LIKADASSRPEAAFVLLLMQSIFWTIAGISSAPFALGGEAFMAGLALASMLFALGTCLCAIGLLWRRRWARTVVIALEVTCLLGSAVQLLLPIGFNRGLVSVLVNMAVPVAVLVLLRRGRELFS